MTGPVVTAQHIKRAGFCINLGARRFCAAHNIDFRRLMHEGIPVSELQSIDDALLKRVLAEVAKDGEQ